MDNNFLHRNSPSAGSVPRASTLQGFSHSHRYPETSFLNALRSFSIVFGHSAYRVSFCFVAGKTTGCLY